MADVASLLAEFQKGIEGTVDRDLYQGTHEGFDLLMCSKTRSLAETL